MHGDKHAIAPAILDQLSDRLARSWEDVRCLLFPLALSSTILERYI